MISLSSCICALLLANIVGAAPAPQVNTATSAANTISSSSVVLSSVAATSAVSSAVSSAVTSAPIPSSSIILSSTTRKPTSSPTGSAPAASQTVPTIDLDPNFPLWNESTTKQPQPIRGSLGAPILGPVNEPIDKQNPDLLAPPTTDHGSVANAKWPFALSHNRVQTGGWARQENVNVMPVAEQMASVNMRLEPGAVRELHWHKTAEWAYVLKGTTQVTGIDTEGRNFIANVGPGDLWYFPAGIPHALQATGDNPEGSEFLLVFDTGEFSEDSTFLLTDWLAHVPAEVLAKNFKTDINAFKNIPAEELFIFPANVPEGVNQPESPQGTVPDAFAFEFSQVKPTQLDGGSVKVVDSSTFKISKAIAAAEVTVEPGAIRELHWHPTQDEWSFFIEGNARMTIFAAQSNARTFDYRAGDIGYVPASMGHYVENTGNTTLRFLEIFRDEKFQDISLAQWLALTPPDLVKAHLGFSDETIAKLKKTKQTVVGPA